MNVKEMISLLGKYPDDMKVVVNGYEQGYDDLLPEQISVATIALNTRNHDWEGQHGDINDCSNILSGSETTVDALVLRRSSN